MTCSQTAEFQPWTTISGSMTQPAHLWLDAGAFDTVEFTLSVTQNTAMVSLLNLQTALVAEESAFQNVTGGQLVNPLGTIVLNVAPTAAVPLFRYVRWQYAPLFAPATITFRILATLKRTL